MLEKEFQYIESQINLYLCNFLYKIDIRQMNIFGMDMPNLLSVFTGEFDKVKRFMGWLDKEYFNRAFLLRLSRNKYFHKNQEQVITKIDEISDLSNIIIFVHSLNVIFHDNPSFNEFEKYLNDIFNNFFIINNEKIKDEKNKLDTIVEQIGVLSNSIDNMKQIISKNTENDKDINNIDTVDDVLKNEVAKTIEKEEGLIKHKKYKINQKKQNDNGFKQRFSSEDLDLINKDEKDLSEDVKEESSDIAHLSKINLVELKKRLEKLKEQFSKNINLITPESESNNNLLNWFYSIESSKWKSMASFAAKNNLLYPNARQMLYKMGMYFDKDWEPSIAQLSYAKKLYNEIINDYES